MSNGDEEFNPLSLEALGASVVRELLSRSVHALAPAESFSGSGIYALYYSGDYRPYAPLAEANAADDLVAPIYIGKAVPKGSRTGRAEFQAGAERAIFGRLRKHAQSIEETANLALEDFRCRYLIVAPVWIRLAESMVISRYRPLWNSLIDGFGNHDPGKGRYNQERSRWDTLHPGRSWAERLQAPPYTAAELTRDVRRFLADHPWRIAPEEGG